MWTKEVIEQLSIYCDLNKDLDSGVYAAYLEDALDEKEAQDFIDRDELRMEDIGEDYMDGDPYNEEYD